MNDRSSQTTDINQIVDKAAQQTITRLRGDVRQLAEVCREKDRRIDELEETLRRLRTNIDDVMPMDCQERP